MDAKDIMTTRVVTVRPETTVQEIAAILVGKRISAVPVVDPDGRLLGIVSEGDLIRRRETGTLRPAAWWLTLLTSAEDAALDYIKSHGGHARDVMTRQLVTVEEDTPVEDVARKLERHHIKRVPVVRDGKPVGIVSRADLIRGLAGLRATPSGSEDDRTLKASVEAALQEADVGSEFVSVVVTDGVVRLWGAVGSDAEKQALRVAAENVQGVKDVRDEIGVLPKNVRAVLWAE